MINNFCKKHLWQCTAELSKTAMGIIPADTVIKNSILVNVCTKELVPDTDIAIKDGRIAYIGNADHCIGENTTVYDAKGKYAAPGFLDGHIHVESSMMTVKEYARSVVPHGTTGIYMDPHEICNVLGFRGVECMMEEAKCTPLKVMMTTPSCVPSVKGFEDTGAEMTAKDVAESMNKEYTVGLGEMMNFPGVAYGDPDVHAIIGETLKADKCVTGHFSIPETDRMLNAYIASGARCCHESTRKEDAVAKMRLGMYVMMREGSAWHDLVEVAKAITEEGLDSRYAILVSDDAHPHTLVGTGHVDHIVRRAIEEGIDAVTAIQMATLNTATCFMMDSDIGSITPGKCADIVLISDLQNCTVDATFIDGELCAENGSMVSKLGDYCYPNWATHSIHIKDQITEESFKIAAEGKKAKVNVIEIIPAKTNTYRKVVEMDIVDGEIKADPSRDIMKAAVFERHNSTGLQGLGFVKGFNIKRGALAQTVAHDAHNLFVIGTNDRDMMIAANKLVEVGGGAIAVVDGEVLGLVELPIAGIMSDTPVEVMDKKVEGLEKAWRSMGSNMPSPFMTMAIIPLACIPELRLTNRGLIDCTTFEKIELIEKA